MKAILQPQRRDCDYSYSATSDVLTVTVDDQTDTFNFSQMPDGRSTEIQSTLDPCPVLSATKANGGVTVELLHWYQDADENHMTIETVTL